LPALPDAWPDGNVEGLCARGGFEIAMKWTNGKVVKCKISSKKGGTATIVHKRQRQAVSLNAGETKQIYWSE